MRFVIFRRFLADHRRSFLWWCLGMVVLVALSIGLYPSVKDAPEVDKMLEELPEAVRSLFAIREGVSLTSPAGYVQGRLFSMMLPTLLLVFVIGLATRATAGSEEDGTNELILAAPVSRVRFLIERFVAMTVLLVGLTAVAYLSTLAIGMPVGALDGISLMHLKAAFVASLALSLLHGALAFCGGAVTGRKSHAVAAAGVVAAAGYLWQGLATLSESLEPLRVLSPWHWYLRRNMLAFGVDWWAIFAPLALSLVLTVVGVIVFNRRDIKR